MEVSESESVSSIKFLLFYVYAVLNDRPGRFVTDFEPLINFFFMPSGNKLKNEELMTLF